MMNSLSDFALSHLGTLQAEQSAASAGERFRFYKFRF